MLRSMYSGISGMRNSQVKLDVVGNNIANVNTFGFKKGRVTFKDMVSQNMAGATGSSIIQTMNTAGLGGTNARQVGLGAQIASIDTIATQGSLQTTNRTLDFGISGDGYFTVFDGANTPYYTRAGNFYLDADGNVVSGDGYSVTGQMYIPLKQSPRTQILATAEMKADKATEAGGFILTPPQGVNLPQGPNGTTEWGVVTTALGNMNTEIGNVAGALDAARTAAENDPPDYADAAGQVVTANEALKKVKDELTKAETAFETYKKANPAPSEADLKLAEATLNRAREALIAAEEAANATENVANIEKFGNATTGAPVAGAPSTEPNLQPNGQEATQSMKKLHIPSSVWQKQVVDPNTGEITYEDTLPFQELKLKSFSVGQDGTINAIYDGDDQPRVIGQVQITKFANAEGLEKVGGNLYTVTANSGEPQNVWPGTGGGGTIISGTLEMSNVDLSEEFTEMIVGQRAFQANSRIITTSDEILQELVNLKR